MVDKWNGLTVKTDMYFYENLTRLNNYDMLNKDYDNRFIKGTIKGVFIDKHQIRNDKNELNDCFYILGYSSLDNQQKIMLYPILSLREYSLLSKTKIPREKSQEIRDNLKKIIPKKHKKQNRLGLKINYLDIGEGYSIYLYENNVDINRENELDLYLVKIDNENCITNLKTKHRGEQVALNSITKYINKYVKDYKGDCGEQISLKISGKKNIKDRVYFYNKIISIFREKNLFDISNKFIAYNKYTNVKTLKEYLWELLVINKYDNTELNSLNYLKILSRYLEDTMYFESDSHVFAKIYKNNYRYGYLKKENPELVFICEKEIIQNTEKHFLIGDLLVTEQGIDNLYGLENIVKINLPLGFEEMYIPFINMNKNILIGSNNLYRKSEKEINKIINDIKIETNNLLLINNEIKKDTKSLNLVDNEIKDLTLLVTLGKVLSERMSLKELSCE